MSEREGNSDPELLVLLSRGDERAFGCLHDRHSDAVFRVAFAPLRDPWDADDVTATVFLVLWRRRDAIPVVDGSILPWLLSVTSFAAKNQLRSTVRYRRLPSRIHSDDPSPDHADAVAQRLDALHAAQDVRVALEHLDPRDIRIVLLSIVHELPTRKSRSWWVWRRQPSDLASPA